MHMALSMLCAINADNIVYIPWVCNVTTYKIRKTQRGSKKVQCRINPKSTEKRGKIRGQMKKLFEIEIVTHEWPPSWKLICIVNWNDWNIGNWACDALTQTPFLDDENRKQKTENR
jgi:hypothetical protein